MLLQSEIIFTIFAEMFGMAFFALLVDHVVRLSDVLDDHRRERNERKNAVVQFMQQNNLDDGFRQRVLEFMHFKATSSSRRSFDGADPRFDGLSGALLDEMRVLIFRPILRKVKLFDTKVRVRPALDILRRIWGLIWALLGHCLPDLALLGSFWSLFGLMFGSILVQSKVPAAFVDVLAMRITTSPFSPDDSIVTRGTYGNSLCIVLTGQVVISRSSVKRRLIMSDDPQPIFGVSATLDERAFHSAQNEFEEWSAESISYCDVAQISHDSFALALAQTWPEGESIMRRVAREEVLRSDGIKMTNALGDKVQSTIWVGNIPSRWATEPRLKQLLAQFGLIQSTTVCQKKGKNKSWGLVTFESSDSAQRALEEKTDVYGETETDGTPLFLKTKVPDLQNALEGRNQKKGALAAVLVKHVTDSHGWGPSEGDPSAAAAAAAAAVGGGGNGTGKPTCGEGWPGSQAAVGGDLAAIHFPPRAAAGELQPEPDSMETVITPRGREHQVPRLPRATVSDMSESDPVAQSAGDTSSESEDDPMMKGAAYLTDQLIASTPLFEGLSGAERRALAKVLKSESYPDG